MNMMPKYRLKSCNKRFVAGLGSLVVAGLLAMYLHNRANSLALDQKTVPEQASQETSRITSDSYRDGKSTNRSTLDLAQQLHTTTAILDPKVSLTEREKLLATSFTKNRKDSREAEKVVEKIFPKLYAFAVIEDKTLKSADDLSKQERYLFSEDYLKDLTQILNVKSELSGSNVGEYARIYAINALRRALKSSDLPTRPRIGQLLVNVVSNFPDSALSEPEIRNSVTADRMLIYALIKDYFPENIQDISLDDAHPICQSVIQSYESNPSKYRSLVGL